MYITESRFCYLSLNRPKGIIARLADNAYKGLKKLCFTDRWHKQFSQTILHVRLPLVVLPSLELDVTVINTSTCTKRATSGHTCDIAKLFTNVYSSGRVGRFSREVW